ncbi:hypothetical protein ACFL5I_01865 [Planctomycetota bacterium]
MPIVSQVQLSVDVTSETVERVVGKWAERLKASAQTIDEHRRSKIPDEARFLARMADPGSIGFTPFVASDFVSRSGLTQQNITAKQAANIKRAYNKYVRGWDYIFAEVDGIPAKRFKDLVEQARQDFSEGLAARTLGFTGTRFEAYGVGPLAALWLTNDLMVLDHLRGGDQIIEGGPYLICPKTKRPGLKTLLNQRLIQAGAIIVKSNFDAAVMAKQNQLTCEQIQGFTATPLDLIPFVAGGDSHVDYIVDKGVFYLEIKVSKM